MFLLILGVLAVLCITVLAISYVREHRETGKPFREMLADSFSGWTR
jgi:hypothetical protein